MDELDRELGAYADSLRPDRQPSFGDLIDRASARRRRTAMAVSVVSVLVVVGIAATAIDGPEPPRPLPLASPEPSVSVTQAPVYGCGNERISGIIDYISFVKANGVLLAGADTFGLDVTVRPADLGQATDRVTCSLAADTNSTATTEHMDNGTASFLPDGTAISEVAGFDPRCRVAAMQDGKLLAFLASVPNAKTHQPAPCAVMPGVEPDGPATAPGDYRSAPAEYQNREKLPDCGSVDLRIDKDASVTTALQCLEAAATAEFRFVTQAVEGSRAYLVWRKLADGRIETWQSGNAGPGIITSSWRHLICTGIRADGVGKGCVAS